MGSNLGGRHSEVQECEEARHEREEESEAGGADDRDTCGQEYDASCDQVPSPVGEALQGLEGSPLYYSCCFYSEMARAISDSDDLGEAWSWEDALCH